MEERKQPKEMSLEEKLKVVDLYHELGSLRKTSRQTGYHLQTVKKWVNGNLVGHQGKKLISDTVKAINEGQPCQELTQYIIPKKALKNAEHTVHLSREIRDMAIERIYELVVKEEDTNRLMRVVEGMQKIIDNNKALSREGTEPTVVAAIQQITNNFQGTGEETLKRLLDKLEKEDHI